MSRPRISFPYTTLFRSSSPPAGSFEECGHLRKSARARQRQRGTALAVGQVGVGAGIQQCLQACDVAAAAIAQHDRFDHRRPAEIVDAVERCAGRDQHAHHLVMAEVRGGDQRRSVVGTGDRLGVAAERERELEHRHVVLHGRDGHDVVALAVERARIGPAGDQRAGRLALREVRRHMQRRAPVRIPGIGIRPARQKGGDGRHVALRGRGMQPGVARQLGRRRRRLRATARARDHSVDDQRYNRRASCGHPSCSFARKFPDIIAGITAGRALMHKRVLATVAVCIVTAGLAAPASAQDYPTQPIRLIVAFGPGGGSDIVARIIMQRVQEQLGAPVVIENKPGAGGTIGNELVANAPANGYTLGIMTAGQIIAAAMSKAPRYDTLTAFDPIAQVATAGLVIVTRPDYPTASIKDLVAAAKDKPGKIVFASPGYGATQHLAAELFKQTAGVDMLHVPFRTSPEAIAALIAGQVDVLFDTVSAVLGQIQSGQLRALGVTGKDRFPAVPSVPPAIESGVVPGYDVTTWYGFFGPSGMPAPVVAKLNNTILEIIAEPEVRERLIKAGVVVRDSSAEAFGAFMASEFAKWSKVREVAGLEQR